MTSSGLEAVFLDNRERLLRFLAAHGAGDAAEDLLQELWFKISSAQTGPIAQPMSYLYRAANNLMLDRYRSAQQAAKRDAEWSDATIDAPPSDEQRVIAREQLELAQSTLDTLGARTAAIFRYYRIDGLRQTDIAQKMGVSLSTVESDLRKAYRAMIDLRRHLDEA